MPPFCFRAQPALDLRRREHDAAQRALARADAERQEVQRRLTGAERTLDAARREADGAERTRDARHELEWYRFWIVRLERERAALRSALGACEAALTAARQACLAARQRHEALERLREKAYIAHVSAEATVERRLIDELAVQRFIALRQDEGV